MKVLVACEFSGIVRDAFARRGHFAMSCDLLDSERPGGYHVKGDVLPLLSLGWDLLIGHPDCTHLCNSGVRWLHTEEGRREKMEKAREFFMILWECGIPMICLENPIPHKYARLPKYAQIVQPWQHGAPETKATCLWLKNLPPLVPTNIVEGRAPRVHHASPGPDRWKERSRTVPGIAEAMAEQWGTLE